MCKTILCSHIQEQSKVGKKSEINRQKFVIWLLNSSRYISVWYLFSCTYNLANFFWIKVRRWADVTIRQIVMSKKLHCTAPCIFCQESSSSTDYGHIWIPRDTYFFKNTKLLGLGRQIGLKSFESFMVFSTDLSAPILIIWVPCPCFPLINHHFYKMISLYIQYQIVIRDCVVFQFESQRIMDLAIVCP